MYPCSNPELIAAVSGAGGIGVIQPISMSYVHGHDLREGIRLIRSMTTNPLGFNALIEKSVSAYEERMKRWIDIALEEGVRFFITALGNPRWVVDKVHAVGGVVYHDVTERKWALKALDGGVDGLICVNGRAGGRQCLSPAELLRVCLTWACRSLRLAASAMRASTSRVETRLCAVQLGHALSPLKMSSAQRLQISNVEATAEDIVRPLGSQASRCL